jgi:hypothetical protein
MRKLQETVARKDRPEGLGAKVRRIAWLVLLGLLLAMPAAEGVSICIGQWRTVMGINTEVRTPILNRISDELEVAHESMRNWFKPHFQRLPWSPTYVLPIAAVVTVLGMMMLRR